MAQYPTFLHLWDVAPKDVEVGATDGHRIDVDHSVRGLDDRGVRQGFPVLLAGSVVDEAVHGGLLMLGVERFQLSLPGTR